MMKRISAMIGVVLSLSIVTASVYAALPENAVAPVPAHNSINQEPTVLLQWENGGGAENYRVYLGLVPWLRTAQFMGSVTEPVYQPTQPLRYNTTYYWRVDSQNSSGSTQGTVWRFRTRGRVLPGMVSNPVPANFAGEQPLDMTLRWNAADHATAYEVYISPRPVLSAADLMATVETPEYVPPAPFAGATRYYWRVVAKNSDGARLGPRWQFGTQAAVANEFVIRQGEYSASAAVDLDITSSSRYELQISEYADFHDAGWQAYQPHIVFHLSGADGLKTVRVRFGDTQTATVEERARNIVLDRQAPQLTVTAPSSGTTVSGR